MNERASAPALEDQWSRNAAADALERDARFAQACAERIRADLEGVYFNPSGTLVPLRPVVLPETKRAAFVDATLTLTRLIRRATGAITDNPAELARRVGLNEDQLKLLGAAGAAHEFEHGMCNGRYDLVPSNGTPVFLEANFSAANMDPVVSQRLFVAYEALYGVAPRAGPDGFDRPFEARARLFRRLCRERSLTECVVVLGQDECSDVGDRRYYEAEPDYLRSIGFESAYQPLDAFADGVCTRSCSVVLKHFLSEYWECTNARLAAMRAAHAETVFVVPDAGRIYSSKTILAWLSAGEVPLSPEERRFVETHVPWTRRTGNEEVVFDGRSWRLADLAVARREVFVLKPVASCGGRGVLIGREADPDAWRERVGEAVAARDCVLQRFVDPDPATMDFLDLATGAVRRLPVRYVLGTYVVDDLIAGMTIRHSADLRSAVVNVSQGAAMNVVV